MTNTFISVEVLGIHAILDRAAERHNADTRRSLLPTYASNADMQHAHAHARFSHRIGTDVLSQTCITQVMHCEVVLGGVQRRSTLVFMNLEWLL